MARGDHGTQYKEVVLERVELFGFQMPSMPHYSSLASVNSCVSFLVPKIKSDCFRRLFSQTSARLNTAAESVWVRPVSAPAAGAKAAPQRLGKRSQALAKAPRAAIAQTVW